MSKRIDLTGQRFGRLVARADVGVTKYGARLWECLCDCGRTRQASTGDLRSGAIIACGCIHGGNPTFWQFRWPGYPTPRAICDCGRLAIRRSMCGGCYETWRYRNVAKARLYIAHWRYEHRDVIRAAAKASQQKARRTLADSYVAAKLLGNKKKTDVFLIEAKREQLKVIRLLKEKP